MVIIYIANNKLVVRCKIAKESVAAFQSNVLERNLISSKISVKILKRLKSLAFGANIFPKRENVCLLFRSLKEADVFSKGA